MKLKAVLVLLLALASSQAHAQVTPGTSPLSVPKGGTSVAAGTSGGVLCFTSATAMASSVAQTANAIMLGGGAGACPSPLGSLGTTTTVLHGNVAGVPSYGSVVSNDLNITATSCSNQVVTAIGVNGVGTCGSVTFADMAAAAVATVAQYFAGTASAFPPVSIIYTAEVTVTFGATTTFDFSTFNNAAVTLTGNITTQTLANITAGKAGTIAFIQDGSGSRTTVWNSNFKFAGGTTPTLSTAPGTIDILSYSCRSATFCVASLLLNVH